MSTIADQVRTPNCIANTPLSELVVGQTRVRSQNTGREGVITKIDPDTRYGPENPDIWIQWDGDDRPYPGWWWAWFTTVDVIE